MEKETLKRPLSWLRMQAYEKMDENKAGLSVKNGFHRQFFGFTRISRCVIMCDSAKQCQFHREMSRLFTDGRISQETDRA